MIVPMKKLSLLLYHQEKENFLDSLGNLGVVHIVENIKEPSNELMSYNEKIRHAKHILNSMSKYKSDNADLPKITGDAEEIMEQFSNLDAERESVGQKISLLNKDIEQLSPWGNFQVDLLEKLSDKGIKIRFFEVSKKEFENLDVNDVFLEVISDEGSVVRFITINYSGEVTDLKTNEIILPQRSLEDIKNEVSKLRSEYDEILIKLRALANSSNKIDDYIKHLSEKTLLEVARLSLVDAVDGHIVHMEGWFPAEKEKEIKEFLKSFPAWYSIEKPSVDDTIPVDIKNGPISGLFELITKIFALPDYFEIDPTPFIAPFYAIFFGLCLGDVGYGLCLSAGAGVAYFKGPKKLKNVFSLVILLGIMTAIAGVFLNSFFGQPLVGENKPAGIALLRPEGKYYPAMPFSIYLGIIQILIGMGIKAYNKAKMFSFKYSLSSIGSMFLVISMTIWLAQLYDHEGFMSLGRFSLGVVPVGALLNSVPPVVITIFTSIGLILLFMFNNPQKGIGISLAMSLLALYNFATGIMADGLSYIRLFALGLAGGLLGAAFNQIGLMFITNANGDVNWASAGALGTIAVLIFGHTLNLGLSALGAFVHSLRLTFVEFYNNIEFTGGGKAYTPFVKNK